jgi:Tol biopolymer transport system component
MNRKIRIVSICMILCSLLFACHKEPSSEKSEREDRQTEQSSAGLQKLSGTLLFQSDRDGDNEIYSMNVDGGNVVQLTDNSASDEYPVWSPDGSQIAFTSNRDGNYDIYLMNADGTSQRKLTTHPSNNYDPAWSPDGTQLAFSSDRESGMEIYLIHVDGSGLTQFTKTVGKNILPAWASDRNRMAYTGNRYLGWNVYVTTLDHTEDTRITNGHGACRPDWSPDASQLAFVSQKADGKGDIWVMKPDGSGETQLTYDEKNYDYYPAWSPDGNYIAYAKTSDKQHGNWELYIMTVDGKEHTQVTDHPAQDKYPDWKE